MLRGKNKNKQVIVLVIVAAALGSLVFFWVKNNASKVAQNNQTRGSNAAAQADDQIKLNNDGSVNIKPSNSLKTSQASFNNVKLVISQQTLPASLNTDSALLNLANKIGGDLAVDTKYGAAYLFVPQVDGKKTGINSAFFKTSDSLIFARPDRNMTVAEWQEAINNLSLSKN